MPVRRQPLTVFLPVFVAAASLAPPDTGAEAGIALTEIA
jgi:hypothetical protein